MAWSTIWITGPATEIEVLEPRQAGVDTLRVIREGLANLGYEADRKSVG